MLFECLIRFLEIRIITIVELQYKVIVGIINFLKLSVPLPYISLFFCNAKYGRIIISNLRCYFTLEHRAFIEHP